MSCSLYPADLSAVHLWDLSLLNNPCYFVWYSHDLKCKKHQAVDNKLIAYSFEKKIWKPNANGMQNSSWSNCEVTNASIYYNTWLGFHLFTRIVFFYTHTKIRQWQRTYYLICVIRLDRRFLHYVVKSLLVFVIRLSFPQSDMHLHKAYYLNCFLVTA